MKEDLRNECIRKINRMWFLSKWDKEDLTQHMDLSMWAALLEMKRNPDFTFEQVRIFTIREINNFAARVRRHSGVCYSNTLDTIDENSQNFAWQHNDCKSGHVVSLYEALDRIHDKCRGNKQKIKVFEMYLEGYTVREIAGKLPLSSAKANRIIRECTGRMSPS